MRDPRRETRLPRPRRRPPAPAAPPALQQLETGQDRRPRLSRRPPPRPRRRRPPLEDSSDQLAALLVLGALAVLSHRLTVRACSLAVPPWPGLGSVCAAIPQLQAAAATAGSGPAALGPLAPRVTSAR